MTPPRVLTIAGSDPSGGAGLQADLKTFQALGAYGMAVVTALTAQDTCGVHGVHAPPAEFVASQLAAVLGDCPPAATKTGMLYSASVIRTVVAALGDGLGGTLVVDPVMVATSGDRLLEDDAVAALRDDLLRLAAVVTPNLPEAEVLAGRRIVTEEDAVAAGRLILETGVGAVLVKGGHSTAAAAVDLLVTRDAVQRFELPWIDLSAAHGTGCTLSAAIAAGLARGLPMGEAVGAAKSFVHEGLRAAYPVGRGAVPVNHGVGLVRRGGERDG